MHHDEASDTDRSVHRSTTWPQRLFWMTVGAGIGAAAMALLDPEAGARRRNRLEDELSATTRDLAEEAGDRLEYAGGRARGAVIESAKEVAPEGLREPADLEALRQRVRSDVIGHLEGAEDVVVAVHADGHLTLKGRVDTPETERELVERVHEIPGVATVSSEVRAAS